MNSKRPMACAVPSTAVVRPVEAERITLKICQKMIPESVKANIKWDGEYLREAADIFFVSVNITTKRKRTRIAPAYTRTKIVATRNAFSRMNSPAIMHIAATNDSTL